MCKHHIYLTKLELQKVVLLYKFRRLFYVNFDGNISLQNFSKWYKFDVYELILPL